MRYRDEEIGLLARLVEPEDEQIIGWLDDALDPRPLEIELGED
jgi:hypothetical protein